MENNLNLPRQNKKEQKRFCEDDKRVLIGAVKKRQHIWDKSHKLHSNRNAMRAAWREIAHETGKSDENCKQIWRSILDSKRYYKQKASKKSGSGCDLQFLSEESQDPWEFSEDLEFLTEASDLRSTCGSQLLNTQDILFSEDIDDVEIVSSDVPVLSPESNKSTYLYAGRNKSTAASSKNIYLNEMRAGVSKMADVMTTLVDLTQKRKQSSQKPFLDYVESLLSKLPENVADDVQKKIIAIIHEEISTQRLIQET